MIKSSLYETMKNIGVNEEITYHLSDIYAWTIDFFRLQKGDKFKVIYTEKFVDDSISIGVDRVKAACFEHKGKTLYAFEYVTNPKKGIIDYFDENAKSLRRAFLRGPLKFNRLHRDTTCEEKYPIMEIGLDLTRELILPLQSVLRF